MSDRPANGSANLEPSSADIDAATRRLMAALEALESAVERRREADRDETSWQAGFRRSARIALGSPMNSMDRW